MEYGFRELEQKWKQYWKENKVYQVSNKSDKPKCYVLDMFPYPSGAGLHVGHPLGYIASDIYARYKRLKGFNVLHPMGYDAFGLPAEQYALETGQHPAVTTEKNIARYREQLDNIGFCYDWDREVRTSDPSYYKWTQWIFLQLFHSWYDRKLNKARPISELIKIFEKEGNSKNTCPADAKLCFDSKTWKGYTETEKRDILMHYRIAYLSYAEVWWCEALGTVLANDEVVNGVSERGGYPVVKKQMRQWFLRITEYADRLLSSLDTLDWTEAMKEMQRNWIGKSNGAEVHFDVFGFSDKKITVFTTRPDTIFGVDFMVLAPEHPLVDEIATDEQKEAIAEYKTYVMSRSERERMSEVKQVTGCFTGAYATHPFTHKQIPVWISEYVLAGYGTGAIMAVPSGDERDHAFAKYFEIPITNIFGLNYSGNDAYTSKAGKLDNSGFLEGIDIAQAAPIAIRAIEDAGVGHSKVNYRLRDAGFSRQRYWGEPFPIIYIHDTPYGIDEKELDIDDQLRKVPVELPMVEHYKPGPEGQGPLANVRNWVETPGGMRETNTMPGYAGSSWYFLRYADPHNDKEFAGKEATSYWREVDIYVGGTEHAVGHLLYSRMWTKVLYDLGHIDFGEPFKKLVNQGMIQGISKFAYKLIKTGTFVSKGVLEKIKDKNNNDEAIEFLREQNRYKAGESALFTGEVPSQALHADISFVNDKDELDIDRFRAWRPDYANATFIGEDGNVITGKGSFVCVSEVEKMSKSKYNVVNPDDIVAQYGADTFRMYEMFLGPIDVSKPWDTKGIEGVHRFLKKFWRLYFDEQKGWIVTDEKATEAELRATHKTIKKVGEDIERFSFNTAVSQFMICVNELTGLNCHKKEVLEPLAVAIAPFAPHLAEELWSHLGHKTTVLDAAFPVADEKHIAESSKKYPVAVNGKTRVEMEFPLDIASEVLEAEVLADATVQKWLEGKTPKKIIYVKGKMINVVV
ncbi:leucine--tRNA ligase [Polluticoccus soli]|uniref:leucine--tRNA ligase n=1 Tax=Polluticoccus soli TaxID=3034150 RepID=UPI0023E31EAA|nr:class I tRNA ligase family protein [Flavipsychrobacter sp. JY13-12]